MADYMANRFFGKLDLFRCDAVLFDLARHEILKRNVNFLLFRISLKLDDLHAIAQRLGDGVEHVRRRDE